MFGIIGSVLAILINHPQEAEITAAAGPPRWGRGIWGPEATK